MKKQNPEVRHRELSRYEMRNLRSISWVSFFWSTSSLMVFAILPIFLSEVLGASKTKIGLIEGIAVAFSFFSKVLFGFLSDYIRARKPFILIGSFLTVIVKPLFAIAGSVSFIFWSRFIDRVGKGVRSAPTDAYIADLSHESKRGYSFGWRQMMYTFGGATGALLACGLLLNFDNDYRFVFWLSSIPAFIGFLILFLGVREAKGHKSFDEVKQHWRLRDIKKLPNKYWLVLMVSSFLMLARFSEMFLVLKAKQAGWMIALLPLQIVATDIIHASVAYFTGHLADRMSRKSLFYYGLVALLVANIILFFTQDVVVSIVGFACVGLHMGMTQGLIRTMLSESIPFQLRGSAFAVFYFVSGLAILVGNYTAGSIADLIGDHGPFISGGGFTIITILLLGFVKDKPVKV